MSSFSAVSAAGAGTLGNNLTRLVAPFERTILPHLDAAYDLARWLTRRAQDAEDVVQEACLRAFQFFGSFQGGDGRAWLLAIVRNTCYTWLQKNRAQEPTPFDQERHDVASTSDDPEAVALQTENAQLLRNTLRDLPAAFREVIVLRELQGLSYREISRAVGVPPGTVMSRLARGRQRLAHLLAERMRQEVPEQTLSPVS
jgi:RNA polymerase sigma-70 factor (ECF subfamily)